MSVLALMGVTGGLPVSADSASSPSAPGADRMMVWTNVSSLESMTDAQLAGWHAAGAGGFVGSVEWLAGMGGTEKFSPDVAASAAHSNEASLAASGIVARAHQLGMKLYLGFNLVNYNNTRTPLAEWFDDASWSNVVLPAVAGIAGAAHQLGFDGLAMDGELYPQTGGVQTATWSSDYPGNTHTEAEVRAEVTLRGRQLMSSILGAFPGVEIADYAASFPDTWDAYAYQLNGDGPGVFGSNVDINFWDGITSVEGYSAIRFYDEIFYKDTGVSSGTPASWRAALGYEENSLFALFSRSFSDWSYAADRVFFSPSAWIDGDNNPNPHSYTSPRDPSYVATQLQAFHDWGMGGEFADYAFNPLANFDYSPYYPAMQAAAAPTPVSDPAPSLAVATVQSDGSSATITGTATDTYAVRVVRWASGQGGGGTAQIDWKVNSGNYSKGYASESDWTLAGVPLGAAPRPMTITAENVHGVVSTVTLQLPASTGPTSTGPAPTGPTSTPPASTGPTSTPPAPTGPTSTPPAPTGPTSTPPAPTRPTSTGPDIAPSASVTASSQNPSTGQLAIKALDGVIDGWPGDCTREWATAQGKAGSWLNLSWSSSQTISKVVLYDRPNLADQITSATLTFSNGTTVAVPALDNAGAATTVTFPPVATTSLLLTITSVSSTTQNIGLAEIQVFGGAASAPPPAPTANAGPNQTVVAGSVVQLDGSASTDLGGNPVYAWTQISGPAVSLSSSSVVRPMFTAPGTSSTLSFCLSVSDNGQSSGPSTVTITVVAPTTVVAPPPVANPYNIAPLASVTASSQNPTTGQLAVMAVDGVIDGWPGDYTREWATAQGKAGSWLNLSWSTSHTISKVVLYDRPNLADQITSAMLTFSNGTTVAVPALDNSGAATTVTFPPVATTSLLLTITSVSATTQNIGLAEIQVFPT